MNNVKFRDTDLREALRRKYAETPMLPDNFRERLLEKLEKQKKQRKLRRIILWPSVAAAACITIAFVLVAPRIRDKQEMARYEGSYMVVDGQRIDDLEAIKDDINEAVALAHTAEAKVPSDDFVSDTERAILHATDDPEMRAIVQRILN